MTAMLAIICLTALGLVNKIDTSMAIATTAAAVAAAGGYQSKKGESNEKSETGQD